MRLVEMLNDRDAPYEIDLKIERGDRLRGEGHFPDLLVTQARVVDVKRMLWHIVRVNTEDGDDYAIGRLIAQTEDGEEIELDRQAIPTNAEAGARDRSICSACGMRILDEPVWIGELRYHSACVHE